MQELFVSLNDSHANIRRADGAHISSACNDSTSSLSASELVAAALGSCIATSLAPLFARHALDTAELGMVIKPLTGNLAGGLHVQLRVPDCDETVLVRLQRAAEQCPVRQALNVNIILDWQVS